MCPFLTAKSDVQNYSATIFFCIATESWAKRTSVSGTQLKDDNEDDEERRRAGAEPAGSSTLIGRHAGRRHVSELSRRWPTFTPRAGSTCVVVSAEHSWTSAPVVKERCFIVVNQRWVLQARLVASLAWAARCVFRPKPYHIIHRVSK